MSITKAKNMLILDEFAGIPIPHEELEKVRKESKKANLSKPTSPRQFGTFKNMTKKKRKVRVKGK